MLSTSKICEIIDCARFLCCFYFTISLFMYAYNGYRYIVNDNNLSLPNFQRTLFFVNLELSFLSRSTNVKIEFYIRLFKPLTAGPDLGPKVLETTFCLLPFFVFVFSSFLINNDNNTDSMLIRGYCSSKQTRSRVMWVIIKFERFKA